MKHKKVNILESGLHKISGNVLKGDRTFYNPFDKYLKSSLHGGKNEASVTSASVSRK